MSCFGYYVDADVFHRAGRSSHTAQSPQRAASPDNFAGSVPVEQDHQKKPRQALVVKRRWATQILEAQETWEIRGTQLHKRGRYALAVSGRSLLAGELTFVDSLALRRPTTPSNRTALQPGPLWQSLDRAAEASAKDTESTHSRKRRNKGTSNTETQQRSRNCCFGSDAS